jgi:Cu(I)/Ag(I) efflux system membrane fusion protein/cobalt-zinc-cadmium efflux system membrane fusion protein
MKFKPVLLAAVLILAGFALGQVLHLPHMLARLNPKSQAGQAVKDTAGKILYWTCGMHPQIHEDHPGDCPICGMKLTPVREKNSTDSGAGKSGARGKILYWVAPMDPNFRSDEPGKSPMGMDLVPVYENDVAGGGAISIDPAVVQNMGVRTAPVQSAPLMRTIRTVGHVDYNEDNLTTINSKVSGWLEKVFVQETGANVEKGQPLYEIYSPELVAAQQEYILSLDSGSANIRAAVRKRLEFFDVPASEIERLRRTREISKTMIINAPASGYVVHRTAVQGGNVMKGADLFRIADLSTVWVLAHIYEDEASYVQQGQEAIMTLPYMPGKKYRGVVDYVYPFVDSKTRDIKVRLVFPNHDLELKPEMFANVKLESRISDNALLIPDQAVIHSGERTVVFVVKGQGQFQPRQVELGPSDDQGRVQVISGLAQGEVVVTSAQFLLDSESRLREAAAKTTAPETHKDGKPGAEKQSGKTPPDQQKAADMKDMKMDEGKLWPDPARGKYVCPMQEDDYHAGEPGKCPICGMALVPTQELHDETHGSQTHEHAN